MKRRRAAAISSLLVCVTASPSLAAETGGCGAFKWPITADATLIESAKAVANGDAVSLDAPLGLRVTLAQGDAAGFVSPPSRPPSPVAFGGVVKFDAKPGVYQITLTDAAWTDVFQDGAALKPVEFSGVKDCDGVRKSLRYELKAGPAVLEISNAPARTIGIAATPPAN